MKLISKFHDYYDSVLAHGLDQSVIYHRARSAQHADPGMELPWNVSHGSWGVVGPRRMTLRDQANPAPRAYQTGSDSDAEWTVQEAFVVVAGKAYPLWLRNGCAKQLVGDSKVERPLGDPDLEHFVQIKQKEREQTHQQGFLEKPPQVRAVPNSSWRWNREESTRIYEEARARFLNHDFTNAHLELGAPVLLLASVGSIIQQQYNWRDKIPDHHCDVVLNPRLVDLGVQRILDPYTAFQNISQFISGVVPGQQIPMVTISDQSKIQKKGFDPKYGFRKRPQEL